MPLPLHARIDEETKKKKKNDDHHNPSSRRRHCAIRNIHRVYTVRSSARLLYKYCCIMY